MVVGGLWLVAGGWWLVVAIDAVAAGGREGTIVAAAMLAMGGHEATVVPVMAKSAGVCVGCER